MDPVNRVSVIFHRSIDWGSRVPIRFTYSVNYLGPQRLELSKLSKNKTMSLEIFDELLLPTLKKGASDIVIMSEKPILSRINGG